jgi:4-hydroxy-2-oxoheptanedioate aldolase
MSSQRLYETLERGELALGTVIHLSEPAVVEIAALAGFDWVSFTLEHAANSVADLEAMQRAADLHDLATLVHVPSLTDPRLPSLLDAGMGGLCLQAARSRADAEALVDLVRFPPLGHRGAHSGVRADRYGATEFGEFMGQANRSFTAALAIEDTVGVENADVMLSVEGITIAFVGLHDLSHSVGVPNELNHPRVLEALAHVVEVAQRHRVPLGLPGYKHSITELRALGSQLVVTPGSDYTFIRTAYAEHVARSRAEARAADAERVVAG